MHFPEAKLTFIEKLETAERALDKYTDNLTLRLREIKEESESLQSKLEQAGIARKYLHFTLRDIHGPNCNKGKEGRGSAGVCTCV